MHAEGVYEPETVADAREAYVEVGPAARIVVRETAKAMAFDREEYRERVTGDVVETARDALFASLLRVYRGSRGAYDAWRADHPDYETDLLGAESAPSIAWHPAPFAGTVVAATYRDEPEAAAATVRRRAFGRLYRESL